MKDICEFCGNDDAAVSSCWECLAPKPEGIAPVIARGIGGPPEDYIWLAEDIAEHLGWSRPDEGNEPA